MNVENENLDKLTNEIRDLKIKIEIKLKKLEDKLKKSKDEEVNYCADNYRDIKFDNKNKNLIFKNECEIASLASGDGVYIDLKFVKQVFIDNQSLFVILKGQDGYNYVKDNLLYKSK